jgi:NADH-ubiquinone oxidoreductase chain 1
MYFLISLAEILIVLLPILLSVAFVTICERKTMGSMQRRLGPNAVGYYGLLQPFADALKLLVKETIIPGHANKFLFFSGPIITLIFALLGWGVIPLGFGLALADFNLGLLYSLAISSLGVYGILIAGWSANSKYAFLGSLRSTAQMISYELILSSIVLLVVFFNGHFNLSFIVEAQKSIYYFFPLFPLAIIFFIGALAETNRAPFDLPEAESELVAGFMTEHSAAIFVFFFLAEYTNIIFISTLICILFLGGFLIPYPFSDLLNISLYNNLLNYLFNNFIYAFFLGIKVCILLFIFIWVRASFPRLRFDQLLSLCWTIFLPIVFAFMIFIFSLLFSLDYLPF